MVSVDIANRESTQCNRHHLVSRVPLVHIFIRVSNFVVWSICFKPFNMSFLFWHLFSYVTLSPLILEYTVPVCSRTIHTSLLSHVSTSCGALSNHSNGTPRYHCQDYTIRLSQITWTKSTFKTCRLLIQVVFPLCGYFKSTLSTTCVPTSYVHKFVYAIHLVNFRQRRLKYHLHPP